MSFVAFHDFYPKLAGEETRFFQILNDPELPPDAYYLEEAYCQKLECDCRRVLFFVFSESQARMLAAVSFGWESEKYYAELSAKTSSADSNRSKGPLLDENFPQSEFAPVILDIIKSKILTDKKYVNRLKGHYRMLRRAVAEKQRGIGPSFSEKAKPGRNQPCLCGSGKKYKKCCMT